MIEHESRMHFSGTAKAPSAYGRGDVDGRSAAAHNDFITDGIRSGHSGLTAKAERLTELQRQRGLLGGLKGRAANTNPAGRFEPISRHVFDDGWQTLDELPPFKTEVYEEKPKTIITRNTSPDISFDRSINPYRGCEHGCIYCFARPTHAYMGLSAGLDFESKLFAKAAMRPTAGSRAFENFVPAKHDRHWHEYRSLSANRETAADHARNS